MDAGTPPSYIEAVQTSIVNQAWVRGNSAEQNNWFGDSVVVDPTSNVSGSAVDSDCNIGDSCKIVSSALLNSVSVGSGTSISGCMIGHNAQIGEGCNLQNVVVDHDAIVPAGHAQNGGMFPTAD